MCCVDTLLLFWISAPGRLCQGNNTLREVVEELHRTFHIGFHAGVNDASLPAATSPAQASAADAAARPTLRAEGHDREDGRVGEGLRDTSRHYATAKATESISATGAVSWASACSGRRTKAAGWFPGVQNSEVRIQFVMSTGLSPTKSSGVAYCLPLNWRPRLVFNGCSGFHYRMRPRVLQD